MTNSGFGFAGPWSPWKGGPGELELVTGDPGEVAFQMEGFFLVDLDTKFCLLSISLPVLVNFLLDGSQVTAKIFSISSNTF